MSDSLDQVVPFIPNTCVLRTNGAAVDIFHPELDPNDVGRLINQGGQEIDENFRQVHQSVSKLIEVIPGVIDDAITAAAPVLPTLSSLGVGMLGYSEATSAQNGVGTTPTDLAHGLGTVSFTAQAGQFVMLKAWGQVRQRTGVGDVVLAIYEGATAVAFATVSLGIDGYAVLQPQRRIYYGVGGVHTYKLVAYTSASTVDIQYLGSGFPAFLIAEGLGFV